MNNNIIWVILFFSLLAYTFGRLQESIKRDDAENSVWKEGYDAGWTDKYYDEAYLASSTHDYGITLPRCGGKTVTWKKWDMGADIADDEEDTFDE